MQKGVFRLGGATRTQDCRLEVTQVSPTLGWGSAVIMQSCREGKPTTNRLGSTPELISAIPEEGICAGHRDTSKPISTLAWDDQAQAEAHLPSKVASCSCRQVGKFHDPSWWEGQDHVLTQALFTLGNATEILKLTRDGWDPAYPVQGVS